MRKTTAIFWGVILMLAGVLLVLTQLDFFENINIFRIAYLWPVFLIILGLMFHVQFFASKIKSPGILVPGGILLVYGCLFLFMGIAGWGSVGYLWPVFLIGPGFGLLELKLFSRGKEGSWVPVIILFGLATFFFVRDNFSSFAMASAVALILIGAIIIISSIIGGGKKKEKVIDVHVDVD